MSRPSYGRQFSYSSYNDSESSQGSSEGGAGEDDSDQFTQVCLLLKQECIPVGCVPADH